MVVPRPSSKESSGSSSSKSKSLLSADVSDPSLDGSKRLLSRPKAKPRKKEPRKKERKCTPKERRDHVRPYAIDAMSFYNQEAGTKYELVEPGYITEVILPTFLLHHIDFTAKDTDDANAPEEKFFAELTTTDNVRCVKFCTSMGPKKSIPKSDRNNGCMYCKCRNVQHPWGGGFMAGRAGLFTDE